MAVLAGLSVAGTAAFDLPGNPCAFRRLLGWAKCCGWDPRIKGFDRGLARQLRVTIDRDPGSVLIRCRPAPAE